MLFAFQLLQITRTSETSWETKSVLPVSFASLSIPDRVPGMEMVDLRELILIITLLHTGQVKFLKYLLDEPYSFFQQKQLSSPCKKFAVLQSGIS